MISSLAYEILTWYQIYPLIGQLSQIETLSPLPLEEIRVFAKFRILKICLHRNLRLHRAHLLILGLKFLGGLISKEPKP